MKKKITIAIVGLVFGLCACKKVKPAPLTVPDKYENGVVVLNEGLFEQNNATLSFYAFSDQMAHQQVFQSENDRGLGDTANDFEAYELNGKKYIIIAVDVSSQVEIVEQNTLKSVAQIPLFDGTNARQPRRVAVNGNRAFVCNFDGTVAVINLIDYTVEKLIEVGANPDGLLLLNDELYVSNSGGLHFPVYDSTVSVINTTTLTVEETIKTRINCAGMVADGEGDVYLVSRGNYSDVLPALVRINSITHTVEEIVEMPISGMQRVGDWLYFYNSEEEGVYRLNTLTEVVDSEMVLDLSHFTTFYGFQVDPDQKHFYCTDANGYVNSSTIRIYGLDGGFKLEFQAGLNANKLIFNL